MKSHSSIAAVLMASLVIASLALAQATDSEKDPTPAKQPGFTGQWVLNKSLSQDLAAIMSRALNSSRARHDNNLMASGGRRGNRMRGNRNDNMSNHPGQLGLDDGDSEQMKERIKRLQEEYAWFEIFFDDPELNLTNGLDISQLYFTDGRETVIWTDRGEMKAQASNENKALRIQTSAADKKNKSGRTRTFSLSEDGSQLILIEERLLPEQKEPIVIRMVFNRAG